jgi:hypothetical protein
MCVKKRKTPRYVGASGNNLLGSAEGELDEELAFKQNQ